MNLRISGLLAVAAFVVACLLGSAQTLARNAYITNGSSNNVSVIDTTANTVIATIPVGSEPSGVAVSPDGSKVYVVDQFADTVSVITTATKMVSATIPVGTYPQGVAASPDNRKVYVANSDSHTVSVIDTMANTVIATIPVGAAPIGVAVTPDGGKVYVANHLSNSVSVIATATKTVIETIPVGAAPYAFGVFIQPAPKFAGTPGKTNCYGQSVSALVVQFGGLARAAAALEFSSVGALQNAVLAFCGV